jgi:23S rRNA pseudouridine1911/1915/1917 synthase
MTVKKRFKANRNYPRIDHFLRESLENTSRSQIETLFYNNKISLNNHPVKRKNTKIKVNDIVEVEFTTEKISIYTPSMTLQKLYEDKDLIIINKPPGISVHEGPGSSRETILDLFNYYYPQVKPIENAERPGIVHRLDKETSGILILAKNTITMRGLQKQFKERRIKKTYIAMVSGHLRVRHGTINASIGRNPKRRFRYMVFESNTSYSGKIREAITHYSVQYEFKDITLIKLFPHTGRTHQLRVHLAHLGHPILGDNIYGRGKDFQRLALHAYGIEFEHPVTGHKFTSCSPLPSIFRLYLKKLMQETGE